MSIQWYPGHMNAARKKAAEQMENTDLVIEVLDARLPEASSNPMVEELRMFRQRPCLKILNKTDLADPDATAAWAAYYDAQEGVTAYPMTTKKPADVARIPDAVPVAGAAPRRADQAAAHHDHGHPQRRQVDPDERAAEESAWPRSATSRPSPRSSKSSTSDKNTVLVDTPGMLWPKIALASDGLMLAASHAVGTNAADRGRSGRVPGRRAAGALSAAADAPATASRPKAWTASA